MKTHESKALYDSLIKRGYVFYENILYPPAQAQELSLSPAKKTKTKRGKAKRYSDKQDDFCFYVKLEAGIDLVTEYRFHKTRKWRFDYANEKLKIAIEQEGGVFSGGRHTRGKGYIADMEKYNEAALQGWTLIRRTPSQMKTAETISLILSAVKQSAASFR